MKKIIVIGGGPAGLMAAGQAAEAGARTILLEKMDRPGLKLGITGKGRCNITNVAGLPDFIDHFGKTGPFLYQAFSRFFTTELMNFFNGLGLDLVEERGGRVFPASGKSSDIVKTLLKWTGRHGVKIIKSSPVNALNIQKGVITGVASGEKKYPCNAVILATGGASYPATGSAGDGYPLAESGGHTIVPIRPALVPLETAGDTANQMAGLRLRNTAVRLLINGKKKFYRLGEMSFTRFGVNGPVTISLSGMAVDALLEGKNVDLSIDIKPGLDEKKLDSRLIRDFNSRGIEPIVSTLRGLLPGEMVLVCLDATGIPVDRITASITSSERRKLRTWLKDFRIEVTGYRPFSEALITAGGVNTKEVDPRTMESRLIKGLYFAGEILDIQADTGGYNLQAAFSTGWLAGRSAAVNHHIEFQSITI